MSKSYQELLSQQIQYLEETYPSSQVLKALRQELEGHSPTLRTTERAANRWCAHITGFTPLVSQWYGTGFRTEAERPNPWVD